MIHGQHRQTFRVSDMGALADNSGSPFHVTADIPTEPAGLDSELAVLHFNSARPGERLKIIERKPRLALKLEQAHPADEMWHQPAHRAALPGRRAPVEQVPQQDPPFTRLLYAAGTVVAFIAVGVMLAWRG